MGTLNENTFKDKSIEAIAKLITMTRQKKLIWQEYDKSFIQKNNPDCIIESAYSTDYKDKIFRIYKIKYKTPLSEDIFPYLATTALGLNQDKINYKWKTRIILDLSNEKGDSLWTFPNEPILNDLYETVQFYSSGVHDIINDILND